MQLPLYDEENAIYSVMTVWKDQAAAELFEQSLKLQPETRVRKIRVIRDYSMFDRREAPQYYPTAIKTNE